jgi:hypothetical protein
VRETAEDRERDRVRRDYAGKGPAWGTRCLKAQTQGAGYLCPSMICNSLRCHADKYEGADMRVDVHWTEKKLEDMTDRDWRIFRWTGVVGHKLRVQSLPVWVICRCSLPSACCQSGKAHLAC